MCGWGARVRESVWMGSKSKRKIETESISQVVIFRFFDIVPVHLEKTFPGLLSKNGALTRAS